LQKFAGVGNFVGHGGFKKKKKTAALKEGKKPYG